MSIVEAVFQCGEKLFAVYLAWVSLFQLPGQVLHERHHAFRHDRLVRPLVGNLVGEKVSPDILRVKYQVKHPLKVLRAIGQVSQSQDLAPQFLLQPPGL